MSTLKQSILEVVTKGENVLQSFDDSLGTTRGAEGNVYECRFSASLYDPTSGNGVTSSVGDLKKYTRLDSSGDKQTYIIKKETADISLTLTDSLRKVGLAGGVLHIPTYIDDVQNLTDNTKLLLNGGSYYTRDHAAKDSAGILSVVDSTDGAKKVFIENADDLKEAWTTVRDEVFTGLDGSEEAYALAGQVVYFDSSASSDSDKARVFNKKFWGKISPGESIPSDTIFYYDGVAAIFDDGAGGKQGDATKEGYFMYHDDAGGAFDIDAEADTAAIFWDAVGLVAFETANGNSRPARYVISGNSGASATSASFSTSSGISTLGGLSVKKSDGSSDFSESVVEAQIFDAITNPAAGNDFWTAKPAVTAPIKADGTEQNAAMWSKTTADDLTQAEFWNLVSEGFQEDHNVNVGAGGLVNADLGGAYSPLDATGQPKAGYAGHSSSGGGNTYRVLEIISTTASNGDSEVEVKTEFAHGLEPGDTVTLAGTTITQIDDHNGGSHTVGTIGGNAGQGTDATLFTLLDISKTEKGGAIAGSNNKGTVSSAGINHLFWGSHNPPTTDQALVYRF